MSSINELVDNIENSLEEINNLTIELTEIPAPPFNETERGLFVDQYFSQLGYSTEIDAVGNVLAYTGSKSDKVILSAHQDTVFQNKKISVVRDGDFLRAPGIGDDGRGLANLLFIAKLLSNTDYKSKILFVASVGEEGLGDLRGVKHLFTDLELHAKGFVTIDGTGVSRIVDQGIGSKRYRLWFKGPGGHSFGSFGTVNPMYALGTFSANFSKLKIMEKIKSTYSLGVIKGGTSINAIPEKVYVDIDMRSETIEGLEYMDNQVLSIAEESVATENQARTGTISHEFEVVGNRPPGKLADGSLFRKAIEQIHQELGLELSYSASSTDANVPMSLGIPGISVGGVAESGRAHTQDEWIKADELSLIPIKRNLLLITKLADTL